MPSKFDDFDVVAYALAAAQDIEIYEPRSYAEAMRTREIKEWNASNVEEMIFLEKNGTWDLVKWPEKKLGIPGVEDPRFKSRLVAKGYSQVEGIYYNEVFAPVVKHVSIRLILSLVVNEDLELEQLDVTTAFLNGTLDE